MNGPVVFVAADPRECKDWISRWDVVRELMLPVHWARSGTWRNREMIAIANGAGRDRASSAVNAVKRPRAVYNIGFCGALDQSLGIGDVFVATEILAANLRYAALLPDGPPARAGILASVSRIAQTAEQKRQLRKTGAFVVEMEAAGAARASNKLGVPFYCVRAVSDLANEDFANDFNECLMPDGRISTSRLIAGALKSPVKRFGELIRLSGRASLASKNLGEYLANCEY